jgi:hypothetical protein
MRPVYSSGRTSLKVLNPLFLDDLRAKLEQAGDNPRLLLNLRKRTAKIRVFDPKAVPFQTGMATRFVAIAGDQLTLTVRLPAGGKIERATRRELIIRNGGPATTGDFVRSAWPRLTRFEIWRLEKVGTRTDVLFVKCLPLGPNNDV